MILTQPQAFYGLRASATPTGTNITNDVQVGIGNTVLPLTGADVAYSVGCLLADDTAEFDLEISNGVTTGTTAWTAGVAQVETATAVGTITLAGNATVVVTAAGMTGSPKTISVPVALNDTAAQWAAKVRTALAADTAVAALFDVSGTSASIILTRKPTKTYTIGVTSVPLYAANDSTLNISLDNGTCTGITTAATSANTTAGVLTVGALLFDGDGKDFECVTLPNMNSVLGMLIQNTTDSESEVEIAGTNYSIAYIQRGGILLAASLSTSNIPPNDITISTSNFNAFVTVTVIGKTA